MEKITTKYMIYLYWIDVLTVSVLFTIIIINIIAPKGKTRDLRLRSSAIAI